MAITFDGATKIITLDSTSTSASILWSRWVDWFILEDNSKWPIAFSQVGGDELGGGLFIPPYLFLMNGWRVRPMESNHTLIITGNLFVDGGGVPVVPTIGSYNVSIQYTVPVQAQGISTSGSAFTLEDIRKAALNAGTSDYARPTGTIQPGTNTTTSFNTNRTDETTDIWKDCLLLFTSGFLKDQVKKIIAYNATTHYITVQGGYTSTPISGDEFIILNY